jgi:hypothetical protein
MLIFPKPDYPIPHCLKLDNIKHYFVLLYWVYFRPSYLKYYLYQSNPELYQEQPGKIFQETFKFPPYRNLYIMFWGSGLLAVFLFQLPLLLGISHFYYLSVNGWKWLQGILFSFILAISLFISFLFSLGITASIPRGLIIKMRYTQ